MISNGVISNIEICGIFQPFAVWNVQFQASISSSKPPLVDFLLKIIVTSKTPVNTSKNKRIATRQKFGKIPDEPKRTGQLFSKHPFFFRGASGYTCPLHAIF